MLIFTESREGTKRYLQSILEQAIAGTERADERIEVITGLTSGAVRKEIQRRFNTDPAKDPLRILIATDAAREGLNFQAHCADLFHFDLPWNPGRIEQRNGRIDRKLQPADEVRCHYFVLPQRAEDRVLEVLVRKTETIRRELGSLSKVIDDEIERRLSRGIRHRDAANARSGDRAGRLSTPNARGSPMRSSSRRVSVSRSCATRSTAAGACSSARVRGLDSSPSRFVTRCHARSNCSAPIRFRRPQMNGGSRYGGFRRLIAGRRATRAGRRRSTRCARRDPAGRS